MMTQSVGIAIPLSEEHSITRNLDSQPIAKDDSISEKKQRRHAVRSTEGCFLGHETATVRVNGELM